MANPPAVERVVAHRGLLRDRVDAVRRADEDGSIRAHVAELHRAADLEQLRGEHDVHVSRTRRRLREDLDPRVDRIQILGSIHPSRRTANNPAP